MADRLPDEVEIANGRFFMIFFGIMETVIFAAIVIFLVPNTQGFWFLLSLSGALFFGCAAIFFFAYCLPPKACAQFQQRDGSYVLLRPRMINILHSIISAYAAIALPIAMIYILALIPFAIANSDRVSTPDFGSLSLFEIYELLDGLYGVIFVLIPLMVGFPWLYPKFLRLVKSTIAHTFSGIGLKLDEKGLSILGSEPNFISWSWVSNVRVEVHGQTHIIVFSGTADLERLKVQLDKRLPKAIRKEIEWTGEGLPMKLDFIRVSALELAEVIRSKFLAQEGLRT